ncbi:MAG: hypothetical protein R2796_10955 [Chitinophagaceae bacterium]|nr:hypothetical protein [Chitinophagaceae bacterium]HQU55992.1 hypothetical protein [Chitinophagaceae bacterium]
MQQHSFSGFLSTATILIVSILLTGTTAQGQGKIDWAKDTVSLMDAAGGRSTYVNTIKASGQPNATQQINMPVEKLKYILDACANSGVTNVSIFIITLRKNDVARYRQNNPNAMGSDAEIEGSQMLVIRVPRSAFQGKASASIRAAAKSSLMVSLLSAGLVLQKEAYTETLGTTGSIYFSFGTICPPPRSCDTLD